jgi:L-iditol 2-dehydrogenase
VEVGKKVTDYKVGDKVIAFGWNNNYAEYFKTPAWQLQPVPEGLDMDIASLGEPVSCAMYSGLNCGVQLGDTVVVMGGGFAGQIIAQCAKKKGASLVAVVAAGWQTGPRETTRRRPDHQFRKEDVRAIINQLTKAWVPSWWWRRPVRRNLQHSPAISSGTTANSFLQLGHAAGDPDLSRWHDDGIEFIKLFGPPHWHHRYVWTFAPCAGA